MSDKTSDKTSDKRLLSCPFCGGEGEVHEYNSFWYKVGCNNQKCFLYITAQVFNSKEEAIEAWNTRKPMQNIVERIEAECKEITKWDSDKHYIYKEGADWMGNKSIEIVKEEGGA